MSRLESETNTTNKTGHNVTRIIGIGVASAIFGSVGYGIYSLFNHYSKPKKQQSSCCNSTKNDSNISSTIDITSVIKDRYSYTARNFDSNTQQKSADAMMKVFGYTQADLDEIGEGNMGLSCGNPVSHAKLKKGEVVLDLGCGAGMDLFLAKKYIGDSSDGGMLLGVDLSQDMLDKAIKNAERRKSQKNEDISNMKFMLSQIEDMKAVIDDNTVDCVISNCVVNLIPNKQKAFAEIYRVLKPNGGRILFSDIALKKELPLFIKNDIRGVVNCVGGAILAKEYEKLLYKSGFKQVKMMDKNVDLNVWKYCWDTLVNPDEKTNANGAGGGCCGTNDDDDDDSKTNSNGVVASGGGGGSCCGTGDDGNDVLNMSQEEKDRIRKEMENVNLNDYISSFYVFGFK